MLATAEHTMQSVDHGTLECRKFLRKVIRDNNSFSGEYWTCRARRRDDWKLEFRKTVRGQVGSPDVDVTVRVNIHMSLDGRCGEVKSFEDSVPVQVPHPNYVCLQSWETTCLAFLLINDQAAVKIQCSSGSTASSKLGLAFLSLCVRVNNNCWVKVGCDTVFENGNLIICGAVE